MNSNVNNININKKKQESNMKSISLASVVVLSSALPSGVHAAVPDVVTWSGTLEQGAAPANGSFSVVVELFDDPEEGSVRFTHVEPSMPVVGGAFVVELGSDPTAPLTDDVLAGGALWVSVTVNGETLAPRVALTSVPYARQAQRALDAETLTGLGPDDIAALTLAGAGLVRDGAALALAAAGIQSTHLASGAVTSGKIGAGAVSSANVESGAIGTAQLASNAVTTAKVADGSLNGADIHDNSLTAADLASGAVGSDELASGAVTATKIAAAAVSASHLKSAGVQVYAVSSIAAATCTDLPPGALTTASSCALLGCSTPVPSGCGCPLGTMTVCPNTPIGFLVVP